MNLTYSAQASSDLAAIADYLNARNPAAARRVAAAIMAIINNLTRHPMRGRLQDCVGVRKLIEPRYGYLIYYHVDEPGTVITVLTVQHHAQARPFDDA